MGIRLREARRLSTARGRHADEPQKGPGGGLMNEASKLVKPSAQGISRLLTRPPPNRAQAQFPAQKASLTQGGGKHIR